MNPLLLSAAEELTPLIGTALACQALGLNRSSCYRHRGVTQQQSRQLTEVNQAQAADVVAADAVDTGAATAVQDASIPGAPCLETLPSAPDSHGVTLRVQTDYPVVTGPVDVDAGPTCSARRACNVPGRALSSVEQQRVLDVLHSERFRDTSPTEVYATILDEGIYHCSMSTMYRLLKAQDETQERRNQLVHPSYARPELLATGPNQVWSWDITKLKSSAKWTYYYLYVIMDIYSRYVVGWTLAHRENATLAQEFIEATYLKQEVTPGQLTLHADRGAPMTSKSVAFLLADLGITKTHSRPHVSNDNPYSEAQFKTLKYRPDFPSCFESIIHARCFCQEFFPWYNNEHHHSGLALLTPETVHYRRTEQVIQGRQETLDTAYAAHPARFVGQPPRPQLPPLAAWINPPVPQLEAEALRKETLP